MVGSGRPIAFDKTPIQPWAVRKCKAGNLREGTRCVIGKLSDPPYVRVRHRVGEKNVYDCSRGVPKIVSLLFSRRSITNLHGSIIQ